MSESKPSPVLNIVLWVVQVLLALLFLMAGGTKLAFPPNELLAQGMTFVSRYGQPGAWFIGVAEVAGAIGLILPAALRIAPSLTGWAGAGLCLAMVVATVDHLVASEPVNVTIVLAVMSAFVAWGRLSAAPISPRS